MCPILELAQNGLEVKENEFDLGIFNRFFYTPDDMENEKNKERPLDCCSCQKDLTTKYTELGETVLQEYYMCADCPHLKSFLLKPKALTDEETLALITCGNCNTSLLEIQKGEPLGCSACYEIFEAYLADDLKAGQHLQIHIDITGPLHLGHKPGEFKEVGTEQQIFALNETLNEMIHREDYEQAASIRDQIKELKKKQKKNG